MTQGKNKKTTKCTQVADVKSARKFGKRPLSRASARDMYELGLYNYAGKTIPPSLLQRVLQRALPVYQVKK